MMLEDFFTLTEMKDGLTALARVEELVSIMQKEKEIDVKNVGEAARQWSTVASTLAVTENNDSLDHFIHLGGLHFIDWWLQETEKCSSDTYNLSVEQSISALLGALKKLPIDNEMSVSSGIIVTVKSLLGHKSSRVQEKARALLDSWNLRRDNEDDGDVEKDVGCHVEVKPANAKLAVDIGFPEKAVNISPVEHSNIEDDRVEESVVSELCHLKSSGSSHSERLKDVKISASNYQDASETYMRQAIEKDGSQGDAQGLSIISNSCQECLPIKEESSHPAGRASSVGTCSSPVAMERTVKARLSDVAESKDFTNNATEINKSAVEPAILNNIDAKESEFSLNEVELMTTVQAGCEKDDIGTVNDAKELACESILKVGTGDDSATTDDVSKPMVNTNISDKIDQRKLDMEVDFVDDDALEVARKVAKEVEQEVVNYREPFCSSSDKISDGVVQPGSPASINGEQDQPITGPQHEMLTGQNLPGGALPSKGEDHSISPKNLDKTEDCFRDQDSSQVTDAGQEPEDKTQLSRCDFDLNEEIHSEEMDQSRIPVSVPITVVSASTSAFHPAYPCKIPDGQKAFSIEGSSCSSKQRQESRNIDLNVTGASNDGATNPVLAQQIPASSGLPSGESSIEVSSRRAEMLKLDLNQDLNRVGDDDDAPSSDWRRMEGRLMYHLHNDHRSPSPALSSSSKQPSVMNIDLNDSPSVIDYYNRPSNAGKSSSQDMNASRGIKLDDPFVYIMGARVAVNRKESIPQTLPLLPNAPVTESSAAANLAKPGGMGAYPAMAYALPPPPVLGHMGPSMSLSQVPMYVPTSVPYMVDASGAPIIPHMMGSQMVVPPAFPRFPIGGTPAFNVIGPNLDVNSGLTLAQAESKEDGGLRQLFIPERAVLTEEQMRSTAQPQSSGIGMKRKEPDGGCDPYPFFNKQQSPQH